MIEIKTKYEDIKAYIGVYARSCLLQFLPRNLPLKFPSVDLVVGRRDQLLQILRLLVPLLLASLDLTQFAHQVLFFF